MLFSLGIAAVRYLLGASAALMLMNGFMRDYDFPLFRVPMPF